MPGLHSVQNMPEWLLNMFEYVWLCLDMSEYARICVNMSKPALMDFVFYFSISPFVLQSLFYLNSGYLFECLQETRVYSLKEHEAVFLKRQNLIWKVEVFRLFFLFFLL